MDLRDIEQAIADEKAAIDAAHAAVAEAREALEHAELAERETVVRSEMRIAALEVVAASFTEGHVETGLHNQHKNASVKDTMNTVSARVPGQRLKTKHLAAVRIRAVDGSIGAFAAKHKLPVTTVRSWYATGEAAREIPRGWADRLAKAPYSIPRDAWRSIATDGE